MSVDAVANFEIVVPDLGTFAGAFSVDVDYGADGSVTGSMSLESHGAVTFTPAA